MKKEKEGIAMNRRDFLKASVAAGAVGAAVALEGSGNVLEGAPGAKAESRPADDIAGLSEDVQVWQNAVTPMGWVKHDPKVCVGCNTCVTICHQDVMIPNPKKGGPPIIVWGDECYGCGLCVKNCPLGLEAKAITFYTPLCQITRWKRKSTGEHFRLQMKGLPPPLNKPPVGGYFPHS